MSLKPCSASGYQNECNVQAAWLNAFCAVGLHEIGKLTSSITGPCPAPGGAAAALTSERAGDHERNARNAPMAKGIAERLVNILTPCGRWPATFCTTPPGLATADCRRAQTVLSAAAAVPIGGAR